MKKCTSTRHAPENSMGRAGSMWLMFLRSSDEIIDGGDILGTMTRAPVLAFLAKSSADTWACHMAIVSFTRRPQ